jgi:hypothetical protein
MNILLGIPIKDWLIIIASLILIICIYEIRKLKKKISVEIHKRILPQLGLEIILEANTQNSGLYLKNESFFLARDIRFEDIEITMDDLGYTYGLVIKIESVDSLRAQERIKLIINVFDKNLSPLCDVTERIIPHLVGINFKVALSFSNIENVKSYVVFSKTEKQFCIENSKTCPAEAANKSTP